MTTSLPCSPSTGNPSLLVGVSRKTMLGEITLAAQKGASILRVHNVSATRDALSVWRAVELHAVTDLVSVADFL